MATILRQQFVKLHLIQANHYQEIPSNRKWCNIEQYLQYFCELNDSINHTSIAYYWIFILSKSSKIMEEWMLLISIRQRGTITSELISGFREHLVFTVTSYIIQLCIYRMTTDRIVIYNGEVWWKKSNV